MPFHRTNVLEEVFEKVEELVRGNAVDVIALDSVAALVREQHRDCRDVPMRQDQEHQHRLEYFLRALLGPLARSRAVLLITNQLREKVGVFSGTPETTPWATLPLADLASLRVDLRKRAAIMDGDTAVGMEVRAKVVKNRLAAPLGVAEFEVLFAGGIRAETDLISLGVESGVLTKRGGRLYLGDQMVGQGQTAAVNELNQNADLAARIRAGIVERLKG